MSLMDLVPKHETRNSKQAQMSKNKGFGIFYSAGFPLPTAAGSRYPELALALAAGERPEPRLGDFRAGLVMTRFFSELVLLAGGSGTLEPFAEELPDPVLPDGAD